MINVCGTADSGYENAEVQVDDRHARTLMVREDEDGRYCGPPGTYAEAVAEYLGVDYTPPEEDTTEESEEEEESEEGERSNEELVESGECPWCDDYEGDRVPQHASSAHPEEWESYKENEEEGGE